MTGKLATQNGVGTMTGDATARFYGPAAVELGGAYFLKDSTRQLEGSFALRR